MKPSTNIQRDMIAAMDNRIVSSFYQDLSNVEIIIPEYKYSCYDMIVTSKNNKEFAQIIEVKGRGPMYQDIIINVEKIDKLLYWKAYFESQGYQRVDIIVINLSYISHTIYSTNYNDILKYGKIQKSFNQKRMGSKEKVEKPLYSIDLKYCRQRQIPDQFIHLDEFKSIERMFV